MHSACVMSANVPLAKAAHLAEAIGSRQGSTLTHCEALAGYLATPESLRWEGMPLPERLDMWGEGW